MGLNEHPFDRVVRLLRERGATIRHGRPGQIRATCPAHTDHKPSLAVSRSDRRVLLHCFAHCRTTNILDALGLRKADLFIGPRADRERPTIIAAYVYTNAIGEAIARKVRTADKRFWWERPDASARRGWRPGLDAGADAPCLYRRRELHGALLVFIVEGEKSADRLQGLGLVATCGTAGASTWKASGDLLPVLAPDAVIAILPDHDPPGERHAEHVAADLHAHQGDTTIVLKVLLLPELPPSADVVDWLDAGHTSDELLDLVDATPMWSPGAAEERRRLHRQQVARDRKRKWREERRRMMATDTREPHHHDGDDPGDRRDDRVVAAFEAVLAELRRTPEPLHGHALTHGRQARGRPRRTAQTRTRQDRAGVGTAPALGPAEAGRLQPHPPDAQFGTGRTG